MYRRYYAHRPKKKGLNKYNIENYINQYYHFQIKIGKLMYI